MKHKYTTTHQRRRNNQSSGVSKANQLQRRWKLWSQLARLWPWFFGKLVELSLTIIWNEKKWSLDNIMYPRLADWMKKWRKNIFIWKKSSFSSRQHLNTHVCNFNGKNWGIEIRTDRPSTIFTELDLQWLFLISKFEKMAQRIMVYIKQGGYHKNTYFEELPKSYFSEDLKKWRDV